MPNKTSKNTEGQSDHKQTPKEREESLVGFLITNWHPREKESASVQDIGETVKQNVRTRRGGKPDPHPQGQ